MRSPATRGAAFVAAPPSSAAASAARRRAPVDRGGAGHDHGSRFRKVDAGSNRAPRWDAARAAAARPPPGGVIQKESRQGAWRLRGGGARAALGTAQRAGIAAAAPPPTAAAARARCGTAAAAAARACRCAVPLGGRCFAPAARRLATLMPATARFGGRRPPPFGCITSALAALDRRLACRRWRRHAACRADLRRRRRQRARARAPRARARARRAARARRRRRRPRWRRHRRRCGSLGRRRLALGRGLVVPFAEPRHVSLNLLVLRLGHRLVELAALLKVVGIVAVRRRHHRRHRHNRRRRRQPRRRRPRLGRRVVLIDHLVGALDGAADAYPRRRRRRLEERRAAPARAEALDPRARLLHGGCRRGASAPTPSTRRTPPTRAATRRARRRRGSRRA